MAQQLSRRQYSKQFRIDAVELSLKSNKTATDGGEALRQERGGCWRYPDKFAFRALQRSYVVPTAVNDFQGFRLVLPVQAGE